MANLTEQCAYTKFCFKMGENARKISEMFEAAFGEQWEKHVFVWFSHSEIKLHMLKIMNTQYVQRQAK
jgi:hypothetical protein